MWQKILDIFAGSPLATVTLRWPCVASPDTLGQFLPQGLSDPGPRMTLSVQFDGDTQSSAVMTF